MSGEPRKVHSDKLHTFLKVAVFWDVAPYSLSTHLPDGGGSKNLWNVRKLVPDHDATTRKTAIFVLAAVRTWNLT
jgi:hypothetical protein